MTATHFRPLLNLNNGSKKLLSICFVSQEYPEETGWGGIGTYTYEMAHGLARVGHKVVVLSRALHEASHRIETDGVEVYRIRPRFDLDRLPLLWRLNRLTEGYGLAVALKLREIVARHRIDLIEAPELHAETLTYSLLGNRIPTVIRLHGGTGLVLKYEKHDHPKFKLAKRLERQVVSRATIVTAPSDAILNVSREWMTLGEKSTVIANPVNTELFSPNGINRITDQPRIICVGTPRYVKGLHVLARAIPLVWASHPLARFVFVAPLKEEKERKAFQSVLGDLLDHSKIELRSSVAHTDMPEIYRHATMCVVPSLWPEPFGYSCAEPMACGIPVIASRTGALTEIIEDGDSGVLVEPDDPNELADAIVRLLTDRELAVRIGNSARERIKSEFASPAITAQMADLYHGVIDAFNARR